MPAATPTPMPLSRLPSGRSRSHKTIAIKKTLICPYQIVVRTGSIKVTAQTIAAATMASDQLIS